MTADSSALSRWIAAAKQHPLTALLLLTSFCGWFVGSYFYPIPRLLVFGGFAEGELWRLITPIFVHFGLMHFAFNGLWLCLLGARIERLLGSVHLLLLVLLSALVSNMGQFVWTGSVAFGGMSGVIYALLGYIWIRHLLAPDPLLALPKELIGFMLFWLLFCMTGILDFLLGVGIANAAHFSGLVIGMLLGLIFGFVASMSARFK
ncbi:rhomboid family intramembrane serine protease [Porticoccaceae bacterium]|nr:rhomboid family intramembrane serine protease [Porticoccaceae bacterium]